ncbi:MAG: DciA family protein [Gemmatimonadales bacterium]
MRSRPKTPTPPMRLAEVLEAWLKRSGIKTRVDQAGVVREWATLVGPQIAKVTAPESVTADGVLRVRVATAPWATELSLMTPRIIGRLNAGRRTRLITGIRWIPGPLAPDRP